MSRARMLAILLATMGGYRTVGSDVTTPASALPMFEVTVGMPDPRARIRRPFRCQLVLMALGEYAFGDHVCDDEAFIRRCYRVRALRRCPGFVLASLIRALLDELGPARPRNSAPHAVVVHPTTAEVLVADAREDEVRSIEVREDLQRDRHGLKGTVLTLHDAYALFGQLHTVTVRADRRVPRGAFRFEHSVWSVAL